MGNKTEFKTRNGKQDGIPQERGVNGKRGETRNIIFQQKNKKKNRGKKHQKTGEKKIQDIQKQDFEVEEFKTINGKQDGI